MKRLYLVTIFIIMIANAVFAQNKPVRLGVVGLSHGHVGWILGREDIGDITMVGIVETDLKLAERLASEYDFSMELVFETIEAMITEVDIEAVAAFGTIYDHLEVVEKCAPKGIHVMVEKPLAVSFDHALKMEALANKHKIHLLTNYETSWYPTNVKAKEILNNQTIGELRKVIVRDGHRGPKKIGVNEEFLEWLTDPVLNGGGAIMDFGCYGANLLTWLHKGKKPNSITAITQQLQPENNPKVDDDATIILNYDKSMAILEPSWNWPMGRKDMELYGTLGAVYADTRNQLRLRIAEGYDDFTEEIFELDERTPPFDDPFALFAAVISGKLQLEPFDPYSLENNMVTMEILDAAVKSSKQQKTVNLKK